jgi:four helix bundle protein
MTKFHSSNSLSERSIQLAKNVRVFLNKIPKTSINSPDIKQLVRSSGSVGANYIEAQEALSQKDFIYRLKVCRKEIKETLYWLSLISFSKDLVGEYEIIFKESQELLKIFSASVRTAEKSMRS